ncbi:MAG: hypothetical protein NTY38_10860 [Acidobacteria bacterium]|nr:hypothetical protein [Acidobacteriota bacterium]
MGVPGGWFSNDAESAWIAAQPDGSQPDNLAEFEYETQFNLTGFDPISVSLQFRIWADNGVSGVLLNGNPTGHSITNLVNYVDPAGTPISLTGASYAFNPGINTLHFTVENTAFFFPTNVSGFRLKVDSADGLQFVPEPSTIGLLV